MSDRVAFYKFLRLGDYMGETREANIVPVKAAEFVGQAWATPSVPVEQGAGASHKVDVVAGFYLESETDASAQSRLLTFLSGVRKAVGTSTPNGFGNEGPLVICANTTDDIRATSGATTSGELATVTLSAAHDWAVGEYVLITDEVSTWDLVQIVSVPSSTSFKANLTYDYEDGVTVVKALYFLEQAYIVADVTVPPGDNTRERSGIAMSFQSSEEYTDAIVTPSFLLLESGDLLLTEGSGLVGI